MPWGGLYFPGCEGSCCAQEPPVPNVPINDCTTAPFTNKYITYYEYIPDTGSPLVSGTSWRTIYKCYLAAVRFVGTDLLLYPEYLCDLTYIPAFKTWRGHVDSPPGEPGYAYRWWHEIWSDAPQTANPALHNVDRKRMWVSTRGGSRLTPDISLVGDTFFSSVTNSSLSGADPVCIVNPGIGDCQRTGHVIPYLAYVPKLLVTFPYWYRMTLSGITDITGSRDGDYLLEGGMNALGNVTDGTVIGCAPTNNATAFCNQNATVGNPRLCDFTWQLEHLYGLNYPYGMCREPTRWKQLELLNYSAGTVNIWYVGKWINFGAAPTQFNCYVTQEWAFVSSLLYGPSNIRVRRLYGTTPFVTRPVPLGGAGSGPANEAAGNVDFGTPTVPSSFTIAFESFDP